MKKIFMILLCICGTFANAQNSSTITTAEELPNWPNMLANLPTSQITSGVLIDKVTDFSKLLNFNIDYNIIFDSS